MADQPDAVRVGLLEPLALFLGRTERVQVLVEAFLQLDLSDHRRLGEIRVAGDMVAVRLGIDQVADRRLLLELLAPAHRVDRLLRQVDHHIAVAGLDKARIASGEIDFGKAVGSYPAHDLLRCRLSARKAQLVTVASIAPAFPGAKSTPLRPGKRRYAPARRATVHSIVDDGVT